MGYITDRFHSSIFPKREKGAPGSPPLFGENFGVADIVPLRESLEAVSSGAIAAGNQIAYTIDKYNGERYVPAITICVGCDDNGVAYIEIQFKDKANTPRVIRFSLMVRSLIYKSGTDFDMRTKTVAGAKGLVWWMDNILPIMMYHTNGTQTKRPGGNNSQQNSGQSF